MVVATVGAAIAVKVAVPVIVVASVSLVACLIVGRELDDLDDAWGMTEWLRKRAVELEKRVEESIRAPWQNFLWQMDWCVRHPYRCFGGGYSL